MRTKVKQGERKVLSDTRRENVLMQPRIATDGIKRRPATPRAVKASGRGTGKRPVTSHIYKHGLVYEIEGKEVWECTVCPKENEHTPPGEGPKIYQITDCSTSKPAKHLNEVHGIDKYGKIPEDQRGPLSKMPGIEVTGHPIQALLFKACISGVSLCEKQLLMVENDSFRNLIYCVNPWVQRIFPRSHNTVRLWVTEIYQEKREKIRRILHRFDAWSSSNNLPLLGVVAHWLDENGCKQDAALGIRTIKGSHTGAHMFDIFWELVAEFALQEKIGYFILDNASTNDAALRQLEIKNCGFKASDRRLRCFGHIVNLIVKALLFGTAVNQNVGSGREDEDDAIRREKKEMLFWRQFGPLGRVHNVIVWIRRSPQRIQRFLALQLADCEEMTACLLDTVVEDLDVDHTMFSSFTEGTRVALNVIADNRTRWNSTYLMLLRALKLRVFIDTFIAHTPELADDRLSKRDWHTLDEIKELLEPFWEYTIELQGRAKSGLCGSIGEVIPGLDDLKQHLDSFLAEHKADGMGDTHQITTSVNRGLDILDEYLQLVSNIPVYLAAVVFDPCHKWSYFENIYDRRSIERAKESVETLWAEGYKPSVSDTDSPPRTAPVPIDTISAGSTLARRAIQKRLQKLQAPVHEVQPVGRRGRGGGKRIGGATTVLDEYQRWCSEPLEAQSAVPDLIAYWIDKQKTAYPHLGKMALEILSIPSMSAEVERLFSSGKTLITAQRARMKEAIIEPSICLRHWILAGLVKVDSSDS